MERSEIVQQGRDAFWSSREDDNPFLPDTEDYEAWSEGWWEGQHYSWDQDESEDWASCHE